jgi:predicted phage terminase large subunit-like protein
MKPQPTRDNWLLQRLRPLAAEDLARDLASFVRVAWPVIVPGKRLAWNWHYDLLCEYLTLVYRRECVRLILNVPPRTLKSTIASICFPVWTWLRAPEQHFLCVSYELDLATTFNVARRRLMESAWFQALFSNRFQLSTDRNVNDAFLNDKGGGMLAASTNARAQGRGGDLILLDDPLSAGDALSDVLRSGVNNWLQYQMPQRLNDPSKSAIVLIQQRLHEQDTTGFLLESEPGEWTLIKLPLVAEDHEVWTFPISGRVVEREVGACLHPARFPTKVVKAKQANRLAWAGQYQQRPAPIEGNLVRLSDVRYYGGRDPLTGERDAALPEAFDQKILSADCAFKDLRTSDFVAIITIGVKGSRRYVLNVINSHLDLDATEDAIRQQHALYGPIRAVLIEDKANGAAVVSHLKANLSGVIAVNPEGGKVARFVAAAPEWQAHDWYVDRSAAWCSPLLEQLAQFPNSAHDDMCDAMSQAAIWLQASRWNLGWVGYLRGIFEGKYEEPAEFPPKQIAFEPKLLPAASKEAVSCPNCKGKIVHKVADPEGVGKLRCSNCGCYWDPKPEQIITRSQTRGEFLSRGSDCANRGFGESRGLRGFGRFGPG